MVSSLGLGGLSSSFGITLALDPESVVASAGSVAALAAQKAGGAQAECSGLFADDE